MKSDLNEVEVLEPLLQRISKENEAVPRILATSVGFLADSYDLFTIDLVVLILQIRYGEELISTGAKSLMVSTMLAGVVAGQLLFGMLADWLGRKWSFVYTAGLTVLSSLACSACFHENYLGLPLQLALCRFLLGLGVGGEYPLSATVPWIARMWWYDCDMIETRVPIIQIAQVAAETMSDAGSTVAAPGTTESALTVKSCDSASGRGQIMTMVLSMQVREKYQRSQWCFMTVKRSWLLHRKLC